MTSLTNLFTTFLDLFIYYLTGFTTDEAEWPVKSKESEKNKNK